MRRAFVIFLILLFPLNVLALSLSVATTQHHAPVAQSLVSSASAGDLLPDPLFAAETGADLDPDEPPAMDLHDIVNHESVLQLPAPPGRAAPRHDARGRCHCLAPPVKPPRTA